MFTGILWEHREESNSGGLHRKRRHLNWTFREWTRILQVQLMGKLSEKSQEDRALGTVRVEGALWGSMTQGLYPSCFVTGMPSYPFTVFSLLFYELIFMSHCNFCLQWRQVPPMRKPSSFLPGSPACGCPHPLLSPCQNSIICCAFVPFIEQGPDCRTFERCLFRSHWNPSSLISIGDQEQRLLLVLSHFSICFLTS